MKEIGGYLQIEKFHSSNGEYHSDCIALNTARNALIYVARARHVKKLYIPYFLCDVVSLVCEREGIKFEYYHTDEKFQPIFDKSIKNDEYLYVVNYYGQLSNDNLLKMKAQYENIIVDNTHAFFQKPIDGIDTIYSCRKFFGVPDGAYLSTDCRLDEDLEVDCSDNRTKHLYGRIDDGATAHYNEFKEIDESFKQLKLMRMSDLTHNMLSEIDYERAKIIREENYIYLHEQLGNSNKLNLRLLEGPFAYPYYCKNGMVIKKSLAKQGIYVPTLWSNVLELEGTLEKDYAENILPLPCDQRYCYDDMEIVAGEVLARA